MTCRTPLAEPSDFSRRRRLPGTGVTSSPKVTTSARSCVVGIPGGRVRAGVLRRHCAGLPAAWRSFRPRAAEGRVGFALTAVAFVIHLYAELFILDAFCLWCTAVHVNTVAVFAVIVFATAVAEPGT